MLCQHSHTVLQLPFTHLKSVISIVELNIILCDCKDSVSRHEMMKVLLRQLDLETYLAEINFQIKLSINHINVIVSLFLSYPETRKSVMPNALLWLPKR